MKPVCLLLAAFVCLTGCDSPKTTALEKQLTDVQAQNTALQARVTQLEARMQAVEASLPEDDTAASN
ncbi:MAG: hypothetical protein QM647_09725 [Asticcacaulis sp.]|uniref:hypothetical protein n=1 Tax=Asticcacaulis sp. TaxID=1872648 RepID=UPI0039E7003F